MNAFVRQYLETALWSSTDDDGNNLDGTYGASDFAPDALARAEKDCKDFREKHADDIALAMEAGRDETDIAHDFWLTRNGHGVGFWCRALGAVGERLTDAAHAYGECNVYVGDDGRLYLS